MTTNDDFSFIRFLKVVKTLYESSSFTQLGKTVRTALRRPGGEPSIDEEDSVLDESSAVVNQSMTLEQVETLSDPPVEQNNILRALAACTSPKDMPECSGLGNSDKSSPNKSGSQNQIVDSSDGPASQSLLEQVMSCTLHIDGDYSDEDTYHGHDDETYGTDTLGETTTYDSLTDDGYESNRQRRSRTRRR